LTILSYFENIPSTTKSSPKFIINSSNDIIWLKCRWNNLRRRKRILIRATNVGLYILGATWTSLEGLAFDKQPRAFDDKDIPSNAEWVKIVKAQGALAINQIHHGGCLGLKRLSGVPVKAVSAEVFNKELEKKG